MCTRAQVNFQRTKQHYFEEWLFRNALTCNSHVMVRSAVVRIVRVLMRVCSFEACYVGFGANGGALRPLR